MTSESEANPRPWKDGFVLVGVLSLIVLVGIASVKR